MINDSLWILISVTLWLRVSFYLRRISKHDKETSKDKI